jgi:hypothetical protein
MATRGSTSTARGQSQTKKTHAAEEYLERERERADRLVACNN